MRTPPITAKYLLGLIALVALNASSAATTKTVKDEAELVAALAEWNAGSGNYEITLTEGTYDLSKIEAMSANGLLTVTPSAARRGVVIRGDLSVPREKVVIDGKGLGRVFYVNMGGNYDSDKWTLENLTVQNGSTTGNGGGLYWAGTGVNPVIKDCIFRDCVCAGGNGGAIHLSKGKSASIEDSLLISNKTTTANSQSGGGGAVYGGTKFTRCTFIDNKCESKLCGGAVLCPRTATLTDCAFVGNKLVNSSAFYGGALYCQDPATISGCVFTNNAATANPGGAVYLGKVSTVASCTFVSNTTANSSGGGVYATDTGSTLRGCTFLGNHAGSSGGGAAGAFACVSNCTFVSNWAYSGGGIASCPNVIDCGFASNYADSGKEASGGGAAYNSTLFICGITNNSANYVAGGCCKCKVFDSYLSGNTGKSSGIQGHMSSHFERCEVVAKGNGSGRTFMDCSFNACTFHDCNSAYIFCRHAYVTNCLFVANKVNRIRSGFQSGETDNTSFFVNCTFVNNSYDYLAAYGSDVPDDKRATFLNCLFDGNGYINSSGNLFVETFGKGYNKDVVSNCFLYTQYSPTGANNINRKTTRQDPRLMGDRDPSRPYAPRHRSCLNGAGLVQDWMASATDLDGHPRLTDGTVAIGAYETTEPVPGMSLLIR